MFDGAKVMLAVGIVVGREGTGGRRSPPATFSSPSSVPPPALGSRSRIHTATHDASSCGRCRTRSMRRPPGPSARHSISQSFVSLKMKKEPRGLHVRTDRLVLVVGALRGRWRVAAFKNQEKSSKNQLIQFGRITDDHPRPFRSVVDEKSGRYPPVMGRGSRAPSHRVFGRASWLWSSVDSLIGRHETAYCNTAANTRTKSGLPRNKDLALKGDLLKSNRTRLV